MRRSRSTKGLLLLLPPLRSSCPCSNPSQGQKWSALCGLPISPLIYVLLCWRFRLLSFGSSRWIRASCARMLVLGQSKLHLVCVQLVLDTSSCRCWSCHTQWQLRKSIPLQILTRPCASQRIWHGFGMHSLSNTPLQHYRTLNRSFSTSSYWRRTCMHLSESC